MDAEDEEEMELYQPDNKYVRPKNIQSSRDYAKPSDVIVIDDSKYKVLENYFETVKEKFPENKLKSKSNENIAGGGFLSEKTTDKKPK